ncbi:bactofilin family protein [Endozoicomonadaceae bacterium StTr2]
MMWNNKRTREEGVESDAATLISVETAITGDIRFTGTLHVEGRVKGNIDAENGYITLSETAIVEGNIQVPRMLINGTVKGDVVATDHLELAPQAVISGNVYYNLLEMARGAQINGSLEHRIETVTKHLPDKTSKDNGDKKATVQKEAHA